MWKFFKKVFRIIVCFVFVGLIVVCGFQQWQLQRYKRGAERSREILARSRNSIDSTNSIIEGVCEKLEGVYSEIGDVSTGIGDMSDGLERIANQFDQCVDCIRGTRLSIGKIRSQFEAMESDFNSLDYVARDYNTIPLFEKAYEVKERFINKVVIYWEIVESKFKK